MSKVESRTVRAVGFAGFSPEAVVLFAAHERDHLHFYPSRSSPTAPLSLGPDDGRRHVILLRTLDKLPHLAKVADAIALVILFADAKDLQELGVPLMDMEPGEDGKLVASPRQSVDKLLQRMEDAAVLIPVDRSVAAIKKEVQHTSVHAGPTLRTLLRGLRSELQPVSQEFSFVNDVGVPVILRMMSDISKDEFRQACKNIIDNGGLSEDLVKEVFRWVEGIEGSGPALGRAVDEFLFNDDENNLTMEEIAGKYGVDTKDLELVSNSYRQMVDQR